MKRYLLVGKACILAFLVLSIIVSYSEAVNLKNVIIEKWYAEDGVAVNFLKDGTVIMGSKAGDYKFIDDNQSKIEARWIFSDLTVLDKKTKLMWTRDANIAGMDMIWDKAFQVVKNLNGQKYGGYSDWRLPTKKELDTLVDFAKSQGYTKELDKLFNKIGFKNAQSGGYWSSTPDAGNTRNA